MDLKYNNFQVQDTVSTNNQNIGKPQLRDDSELKIERNTIEIVSIREFTVDSARLVKPKKVRIITKTIPQIPKSDSIDHPTYNVVENNFFFPHEPSFFDDLHFNPYNPSIKNINNSVSNNISVKTLKKNEKQIAHTTKSDKDFISINKLNASKGFISTDWMLGIIIFSLILFSWLRVGYSRFFQAAIQASYNYFTARRINEEVNITRTRVFYFMNLLFYVTIAMFITQFLEFNHITIYKLKGILLFFTIFISIITLYTLKSIVFSVLDFVFLGKKSFSSYIFTVFLYNKMVGLILLPLISILPYVPDNITPWLFYAGTFVIIILYILRIFRGLQISFKNRLSIFYLILYLCALEILPNLILFKVILNYLQN